MTHIRNYMILNCGDDSNGKMMNDDLFLLEWIVDCASWWESDDEWWWLPHLILLEWIALHFSDDFLMIFLMRNKDYFIYSCSSGLLGIFLLFSEYLHLTKDALCWITTQSKFLIFLCFDIGLFRIPLLGLYFLIIPIDTFDAIQCMAMLDMFTFRAAYNVWFFIKFPNMPKLKDVWKFSAILQSCRIAHITKE